MSKVVSPNDTDAWVDTAVFDYLNPDQPKSFFLFAGAGSGKTRTLVNVLARFKEAYGQRFRLNRQKVGIITYTNAAADEITHRLSFDPIFQVSTIHSFAWELIKSFTIDIKAWLRENLKTEIAELQEEQSRSRNLTNVTSVRRAKKIESKTKRLSFLDNVAKFVYNPNGDNETRDALNHAEVIQIAAYFILSKPLMQELVCCKYPVLLIDESQDTRASFIDAIFALQQVQASRISVGLFGDTMQRIYQDGKENLQQAFPKGWETPAKKINHRSSKRIISLINSIRKNVDGQEQVARVEKPEGIVRLFLCDRNMDKPEVERLVTEKMESITKDKLWNTEADNVKSLILEHHMAARRMGFYDFFVPLHGVSSYTTGVLDGTLPGVTLFTKIIAPILSAHRDGNSYETTRLLRQYSTYFNKKRFLDSRDQPALINECREGFGKLMNLWTSEATPTILKVLQTIAETSLFEIPAVLVPFTIGKVIDTVSEDALEEESSDASMRAWEQALSQSFDQIERYSEYLSEHSKFGTHQGVKGLEYPRVIVIIDDEEARGFMFSYDKLLGAKAMKKEELDRMTAGQETHFERTRRLFYVACSRAKDSLAVIVYTDNPVGVRDAMIHGNWFTKDEIEEIK